MIRKTMLALGLLTALALPATAVAKPTAADKRNAAKECRAERGTTEASREAFAEKYRNFGHCVSQRARQRAAARRAAKREEQERTNAAKECAQEREQVGEEKFAEQYGTNGNKRNAFGKCVASKVGEDAPGGGS